MLTLDHLLSSVNLCDLFLEKLVTLLANGHNFLTSHTQGSNILQNLLGDCSSILVFGEGVGVVERVIYQSLILLVN